MERSALGPSIWNRALGPSIWNRALGPSTWNRARTWNPARWNRARWNRARKQADRSPARKQGDETIHPASPLPHHSPAFSLLQPLHEERMLAVAKWKSGCGLPGWNAWSAC